MSTTAAVRKGMTTATLILMSSVLLSRILGLLREALLAARLGTGSEADAYATAFLLPDLVNTLLAGGFLSVSFVPLYVRALRDKGDAGAARFLGGVLLFLGGLGVVGIAALMIWARPALALLQPGLVGTPAMELAVHLTRILLPAQIGFLLAGAWNGAQYARKHFLYPALAPLVYNVGILAGGWFLAPWMGAEGFAWGVLAGALVGHLGLQAWGARVAKAQAAWPTDAQADLKAFLWRTFPLMLGLTLGFSAEFLLRRLSGYLGQGAVAEASYAFRLTMVLVAFFGQSMGVASYPYLVELASKQQWEEFQALLQRSLRQLVVALIPASALVAALAPELVRLAFQRGAFGEDAVQGVAQPLRWMVWAVFPWCVQIVIARGWYALDRFWTGAALGTLAVGISWPVWGWLVQEYGRAGVGPGLLVLVLCNALIFSVAWLRTPRGKQAFVGVLPLLLEALLVSVLTAQAVSLLTQPLDSVFLTLLVGGAGALFLLSWGCFRNWPGVRVGLQRLGSRFWLRNRGTSQRKGFQ